MTSNILKKTAIAMAFVFIALFFMLLVAPKVATPDFHRTTIETVDKNIGTVMKLTGTSTVASAAISMIPGDTATPIANKLADFSTYFAAVLCILYLEKYLVVIFSVFAFGICIPAACGCMIIDVVTGHRMRHLALKLLVSGLIVFLMIPASVGVSNLIYKANQASIDSTIESAENISEDIQKTVEGDSTEKNKGISLPSLDGVVESFSLATQAAEKMIRRYTEALVVMIVTSCLIPVIVFIFLLQMIKLVFSEKIKVVLPENILVDHNTRKKS